jgi:hypothetical protein
MIKEGSRVRHRNSEIDAKIGVMKVFSIKNGYATCASGDFHNLGAGMDNYLLSDLVLA